MSEEALEGALRRLERANESLRDFAYGAAHDLKGPLEGIGHLAGFVLDDVGSSLPEASRCHLEDIRGRVEQLSGLIDGLLEFATLRGEASPREFIDLSPLVQRVWKLWNADSFTLVLSLDLPDIFAPPAALLRVLSNVLGNAVMHHDRGSGVVTVETRDRPGCVELIIRDDGPGLSETIRGQAMEPLRTLHAGPRKGSGMGLALVERTMEQLGGSVRLESAVPRGLSVILEWPKG